MDMYVWQALAQTFVGFSDFAPLRVLWCGAYGLVRACLKKDTGKLYVLLVCSLCVLLVCAPFVSSSCCIECVALNVFHWLLLWCMWCVWLVMCLLWSLSALWCYLFRVLSFIVYFWWYIVIIYVLYWTEKIVNKFYLQLIIWLNHVCSSTCAGQTHIS